MYKSREEIQRPQGLHLRGRGGGGGTSNCDRRKTRRTRYPGSQRKKVFEKEGGRVTRANADSGSSKTKTEPTVRFPKGEVIVTLREQFSGVLGWTSDWRG